MTTSEAVEHQPCIDCTSSDGMAVYTDGHTYCFVCGKYHQGKRAKGTEPMTTTNTLTTVTQVPENKGVRGSIRDRGIVKDTVIKYGVGLGVHNKKIVEHYYPYLDINGKVVAYKTRKVATKEFHSQGNMAKGQLFGQGLFPASSAKGITVFVF